MSHKTKLGYVYLFMFIANVVLANWLIQNVGVICYPPCVIPVWFGIYAPSGVLAIGLGFTLRDLIQRYLGIVYTLLAISIGAALSIMIDPYLGIASGIALILSELLDFIVYTPLQKRNLILAVIASNIAGIVIDSCVFLFLAFGSLDFIEGQILGKLWLTLLAIPVLWLIRKQETQVAVSSS